MSTTIHRLQTLRRLGAAVNYTHVSSNASINPALLATGNLPCRELATRAMSALTRKGMAAAFGLQLARKYLCHRDPNEAGQPTTQGLWPA